MRSIASTSGGVSYNQEASPRSFGLLLGLRVGVLFRNALDDCRASEVHELRAAKPPLEREARRLAERIDMDAANR